MSLKLNLRTLALPLNIIAATATIEYSQNCIILSKAVQTTESKQLLLRFGTTVVSYYYPVYISIETLYKNITSEKS